MKLLSTVCTAALLASSSSFALEGDIVAKGRYPYVIELSINFKQPKPFGSSCTATILEPRLIITAAHCLVQPYADPSEKERFFTNGTADLSYNYLDATGQWKVGKAKYTIWHTNYPSNKYLYDKITGGTYVGSKLDKLSSEDKTKSYEAFARYSTNDVAYIIPDRVLNLSSYPKWVFGEMKPVQYLESAIWFNTNSNIPSTSSLFKKIIGIPDEGVVFGFGGKGCKPSKADSDIKDEKTCTFDHKKRFTVIPFTNYARTADFGNVKVSNGPPWGWYGGKVGARNPMVYGDSGGPLFVKNSMGDLVLVGINSSSGNDHSYHSSPLWLPNLYQQAINSAYYKSLK